MSINWFPKLEEMIGLIEQKARVKEEREALSREELNRLMKKLVFKIKASYDGLTIDDEKKQ